MSLHLVIHSPARPDAEAAAALADAMWEVAESHWPIGAGVVLLASDLSPDYLLAHLRAALRRRGMSDPGLLLVTPLGEGTARTGLPAEAEAWIAGAI